jgi:hypothetical protein
MEETVSDESLEEALAFFARKVWNGKTGAYCSSAWELRDLADRRCFPGLPF